RELGHRIKLLAIAKESGGELEARVHPTLIPTDHLLASVGGVYNAIWLHGDAVGSQMFSGRGAGQMPTASAVVSDLVEIAHNIVFGRPSRPSSLALPGEAAELKLRDMARVRSCYYLRVMAIDKPRVLSRISGILGEHNISIASVIQKGRGVHAAVPVVFMTHAALEGDMRKALRTIDHLDVVAQQTTCIRVEGDED
ncbi:MAG TPA: ACT domain-containing protein, partial [Candidatus Sulfotelmatobacter sp.]|nr:ACT domain-containing protein [Candidatus Sulfotelmatobacter sp.]